MNKPASGYYMPGKERTPEQIQERQAYIHDLWALKLDDFYKKQEAQEQPEGA